MTLNQLHKAIVALGIDADPRDKKTIKSALAAKKKIYDKLSDKEKSFFDHESLWNPFSDTRIIAGDENREIKKIILGIDIDTAELLMIERLNEKGAAIDLVIAHHPSSKALATLPEVMGLQSDIFYSQGVSISASESLIGKRQKQVERSVSSANFLKTKMAADHLGLALMCAHTPADSLGVKFLENKIKLKRPGTLGDLKALLLDIPEYAEYAKYGCQPNIINGGSNSRVRKFHFEFTGGTEGPIDIYDRLSASGVDTIISMHQSERHLEAASKANINVILAGHMASDILGLNLMLDSLVEQGNIEVMTCSGFIRIARRKDK